MIRTSLLRMSQSPSFPPSLPPTLLLSSKHPKSIAITLNSPKTFNALGYDQVSYLNPLYAQLIHTATASSESTPPGIITLKGSDTGKKTKAFCSGGDVRKAYDYALASFASSGTIEKGGLTDKFFREEYRMNYKIHLLGELYKTGKGYGQVSMWDGITMGGGVGLSIHAPFRVCTPLTTFAMPETGIGLFPDVGGSYWLSRLERKGMGLYVGLTGRRLSGVECCVIGVGTHYFAGGIDGVEEYLVDEVCKGRNVGEALDEIMMQKNMEVDGGTEKTQIETDFVEIEQAFSEKKSVAEIIETLRGMDTPFGKTTLATMLKMSPLAMSVTFEMINRGGAMTMKSCLAMEFQLSQATLNNAPKGDFYEGIRAVLVDKDHKPVWNHGSVEEVGEEEVMKMFEESADVEKWEP